MSRLVTRAGAFSPFGAGAPPMKAISSSRDGIAAALGAAGAPGRRVGWGFGKV
jgi:hypothetical protein